MDVESIITANMGLVYSSLHKFNLAYDQEAESYAMEGLYKAAVSFDKSRGYKFSTYAMVIIYNALRMHLRQVNKKKQIQEISYYTESPAAEGTYLLDTLTQGSGADAKSLSDEACKEIIDTFNKHIRSLHGLPRSIIRMFYANPKMTQYEIATSLGVSQPTVSRAIATFLNKLRKDLEEYM